MALPIPSSKQTFIWVRCLYIAGCVLRRCNDTLNADTIIPRPIQQIRPIQSELILLPAVSHTLAPQPFIEIPGNWKYYEKGLKFCSKEYPSLGQNADIVQASIGTQI